jgi:uncharacterized protein
MAPAICNQATPDQPLNTRVSTVLAYFVDRNANFETLLLYHGLWDMISMMFIGIALLRVRFFSNKLSTSTYGVRYTGWFYIF